jgi:hypothetical protein
MPINPNQRRTVLENFAASQAWRELPLKIKLMLVHIWRRETEPLPPPEG